MILSVSVALSLTIHLSSADVTRNIQSFFAKVTHFHFIFFRIRCYNLTRQFNLRKVHVMKTVKKVSYVILLIMLLFTVSSCSKFKYDNKTVIGMVTSIDGQKVTMNVSESDIDLSELQNFTGSFSGDMSEWASEFSNEFPYGEFSSGDMPDLENLPETGEIPNMGEMPDMGSIPGFSSGSFPGSMTGGSSFSFEDGDEITLTLNEDVISQISVGSIVQISFGDNGTVLSFEPIDITAQGTSFGGGFFGGTN